MFKSYSTVQKKESTIRRTGTMQKTEERKKDRIFTIPNILTTCRIFLIPIFVWFYSFQREEHIAFGILILSGITDMLDGFIARRFRMISSLGKALDPVADKLTQAAVLICLGSRYPLLLILAGMLVVKESITGCMSLLAIQKTNQVKGADWHGKVTTVFLYITMLIHIIWDSIPFEVNIILIGLSAFMMVVSFVMYFCRNISLLKKEELV